MTCNENVWGPKAKGLLSKLKYQKFQASILKRDVFFLNDQMLCIVWSQMKSFKLCNKVLWEVIYAYFCNWDWLLYLVLIVYVLIELIIEISH